MSAGRNKKKAVIGAGFGGIATSGSLVNTGERDPSKRKQNKALQLRSPEFLALALA